MAPPEIFRDGTLLPSSPVFRLGTARDQKPSLLVDGVSIGDSGAQGLADSPRRGPSAPTRGSAAPCPWASRCPPPGLLRGRRRGGRLGQPLASLSIVWMLWGGQRVLTAARGRDHQTAGRCAHRGSPARRGRPGHCGWCSPPPALPFVWGAGQAGRRQNRGRWEGAGSAAQTRLTPPWLTPQLRPGSGALGRCGVT